MRVEDLLTALGKHYSFAELPLDKHNVCRLVFEGGHEIFIEPDTLQENTHLYAVLGRIPSIEKEQFYEAVFEKNLFGKETGQAFIHCDVKRNEVLLGQFFNHSVLDGEQFVTLVENFVHRVIDQQEWMEHPLEQGREDSNRADLGGKDVMSNSFANNASTSFLRV